MMWFKTLLLICLCMGNPFVAMAQEKPQQPSAPVIAEALTKQIHLTQDMTLKQAMQSLSEQIGVPIQLADYLTDRHVTLKLDHVTAKDALDALVDLEDWQWSTTPMGQILIERRRLNVPREVTYIPRWLQIELPRDFRDYFDLSLPSNDPKKYYWAVQDDQYFKVSKSFGKILRLRADQQRRLLQGHLTALNMGAKVHFTELTAAEKENLLIQLTMHAIYQTGATFWKGDLAPYIVDPENATVQLKDTNSLLVGTEVPVGDHKVSMGFGATVKR